LEQSPQIDFRGNHDGCLFTATVTRNPVEELDLVDSDAPKTDNVTRRTGDEPEYSKAEAAEPHTESRLQKDRPLGDH